jgi:hypothetical protein
MGILMEIKASEKLTTSRVLFVLKDGMTLADIQESLLQNGHDFRATESGKEQVYIVGRTDPQAPAAWPTERAQRAAALVGAALDEMAGSYPGGYIDELAPPGIKSIIFKLREAVADLPPPAKREVPRGRS